MLIIPTLHDRYRILIYGLMDLLYFLKSYKEIGVKFNLFLPTDGFFIDPPL